MFLIVLMSMVKQTFTELKIAYEFWSEEKVWTETNDSIKM